VGEGGGVGGGGARVVGKRSGGQSHVEFHGCCKLPPHPFLLLPRLGVAESKRGNFCGPKCRPAPGKIGLFCECRVRKKSFK